MFDLFGSLNQHHVDGRQCKRVAVKSRASLVVTTEYETPRVLPCLIIDISQYGFRVHVPARLRRGQFLEVVREDDQLAPMECQVKWIGKTGSKEQDEAGLQIVRRRAPQFVAETLVSVAG